RADRIAGRSVGALPGGLNAVSRVLLVDPDRAGLAALQAALGAAGFRDVSAVTSASFALTMLERNRPDLIVSRVGVPDIDGYELCSIVRNDPSMTGVLFLLLASPGDAAPEAMLEGRPGDEAAVGMVLGEPGQDPGRCPPPERHLRRGHRSPRDPPRARPAARRP